MFDETCPINATVVGSDVAKVDYRKCQLLAETTRQSMYGGSGTTGQGD
jgi:hypothetical protein